MPQPQSLGSSPGAEGRERFLGLIQSLLDEFELLTQQPGTTSGSVVLDLRNDASNLPLKTPQLSKPVEIETPAASAPQSTAVPLSCAQLEKADTLADLSAELNHAYIEELRTQFDILDEDEDDHVTLDQCDDLVEHFLGHKLEREQMLEALSIHDEFYSGKLNENKPPNTKDDVFIHFDHFLHLMGADSKISDAHSGITDVLRAAFRKASEEQERLAEQARVGRRAHRRLVFFLDIIPAPVIVANAIVMGLRTDFPDWEHFSSLDTAFLVFYCLECATRLYVFGLTVFCFGPDKLWNWFDVICIVVGSVDSVLPLLVPGMSALGNIMLLKMLRLVKLARLVKALHYPIFAELKFMIMGVASGLRVLLWALVLLSAVIYFVGVSMTSLIGDKYEELSSVPKAMFTIFRCLTDGCAAYDGTPLQERISADFGLLFVIPYVLIIMLVIFGLFNLIMAVFVGKIGDNSARRRQEWLASTADSTRLRLECCFARFMMACKFSVGTKHHMLTVAEKEAVAAQMEADELAAFRALPHGMAINRKIFDEWLKDEDVLTLLDDVDVDTSNLTELYDCLDSDMNGSLTPVEVIDGLMRLRGPITKIDMLGVRLKIRYCTNMLRSSMAD